MPFSFDLTTEQEQLTRLVREFAVREIAPRAAEIDEKDELPVDLWKKMAQPPYSFTGVFIPREYGGTLRSIMDICIIVEELTGASGSAIAGALMEATGLATTALISGGNHEQKQRYLPPVARGERFACFALTEPHFGSDAAAVETRAELQGDYYVLNGRKRYASFASVAAFITLFARTNPSSGSRGISSFIVEPGTPGFEVVEKVPCLGMRGHQDEELLFQDCRIPRENLIGEEGWGLKYALGSLDRTRITLSCGYLGLARRAIEDAVSYAKARKAFGQAIAEYQAIRFPLSDVHVQLEAARLLAYRAAWLADRGKKHTAETAAAKYLASEVLLRATNLAIEAFGGFGCTRRHPVERYYRDARIWVFAQGAPNIQRLIVSRELFK